jgi:hypothetical protein
MTQPSNWVSFTRTICPKTGIHYLDAIDSNGRHWIAQQHFGPEKWLTFVPGKEWQLSGSQPYNSYNTPNQ